MPLTKLQFRPGINRETTSYANEGGWFDGDKIRFRAGFPEKIGGWQRVFPRSFLGSARSLHPWRTLGGTDLIGVGTSLKFYVNEGGAFNDITPLRFISAPPSSIVLKVNGVSASGSVGSLDTNTAQVGVTGVFGTSGVGGVSVSTDGSVSTVVFLSGVSATAGTSSSSAIITQTTTGVSSISFSATSGSDEIVVSNVNHGAVPGDFVTFRAAEGLGGNITADVLNQEYVIEEVLNFFSYTIRARQPAPLSDITVDGQYFPTYVIANSSDTGSGGTISRAEYQIHVGLDTSVAGSGWGAGTWSRGTWGSPANLTIVTDVLRLWEQDNFGEDLVFNVNGGEVFYWDRSASSSEYKRAVALSDLPGSLGAPTVAHKVLVSDVDRHIIAFGCDPVDNIGVQDPLLIRFSDQENALDWIPTATNTAGDLLLGSGSEIVAAVETRQQIIVFTDISLHAMQYIGPPFTFGISMISENITIASPNAAVAVNDNVFWMGDSEFYVYGGSVSRLPCTVRDYVFNNFNFSQEQKVFAAVNSEHSEVWWFYPSESSLECDRYVVFNYLEQVWYYGNMARTSWIDRGLFRNPIAASDDGYLYYHELGFDDGSTTPSSPIAAYVQSSPLDIGEGDRFMFISRLLPDMSFRNSTASVPTAQITLDVRNFQRSGYSASSTQSIDEDTQQLFFRLRGRQMRFRIGSEDAGVTWRLGFPRIEIRPDGRR